MQSLPSRSTFFQGLASCYQPQNSLVRHGRTPVPMEEICLTSPLTKEKRFLGPSRWRLSRHYLGILRSGLTPKIHNGSNQRIFKTIQEGPGNPMAFCPWVRGQKSKGVTILLGRPSKILNYFIFLLGLPMVSEPEVSEPVPKNGGHLLGYPRSQTASKGTGPKWY